MPIWLDQAVLKAVTRDKRRRFESAEKLLLAIERDASRLLTVSSATPLIQREPTALWKLALGISMLKSELSGSGLTALHGAQCCGGHENRSLLRVISVRTKVAMVGESPAPWRR